jgi:glycosyltransferase involved in cell wall biosynthesis
VNWRPTRILLIAPSLDIVGGQAVQASRLLELLRDAPGVQVDFLPINPRLPRLLRGLQKVKYLRTLLTSGSFVCKLLARAGRYDILHSFSAANYSFLLSAAPVVLVSRLFGKRSIINYLDGRASQHLTGWRTSRLLRLADRIVTPSEYLVDVFAQFGYRAQSIYNVIDLERFRFRERKPVRPVFLHNRGLEELYNVPCTLKAFGLVQQHYPEARLIVAHDGPLRAELERKVKDWGLRNVRFVGTVPQNEVPALYDAADIYLTSPNIDNMPGSLLECYASGLPLVATNVGGIPYIARNEETALLVDVNDHEGMARAALRLIAEEGLAQRLTIAARQQCSLYSGTAIGNGWLALYDELHSTRA